MAKRALESSFVPDYQSESDSSIETIPAPAKKPYVLHDWVLLREFDNALAATDFIRELGGFGKRYTNTNQEKVVVVYRCSKVKARGVQCAKSLRLEYDQTSDKASLYETDKDHTCAEISASDKRMTVEQKKKVEELFQSKVKPKRIFTALAKLNMPLGSMTQLNNFLVQLRNKAQGSTAISMGELEDWCQTSSACPTDIDSPYVLAYQFLDNACGFRFMVTTKRLLDTSRKSAHLNADATYKLIWQGYPVLVIGTTDFDRKFHMCSIVVSTDESGESFEFAFEALKSVGYAPSILVSDAAPAIRNAFSSVFGSDSTLLMCWAHVKRNVIKNTHLIAKEFRKEILSDLDDLQLSPDPDSFTTGKQLFISKWADLGQGRFLEYMAKHWFSSHQDWFEGAEVLRRTPSTNNALEAFNNVIKTEQTHRVKVPLARFRKLVFELVQSNSEAYVFGNKVFAEKPTLTHALWVKAYQWAKRNVPIDSETEGEETTYFVPSTSPSPACSAESTPFDQHINSLFSNWTVTICNQDFLEGYCSCPSYFKKKICKHLLGLAIRMGWTPVPPAAKGVQLGSKPKRGRPKKAGKALLVD